MFFYQLKKDDINITASDDTDFCNQLWNQTYFSQAKNLLDFLEEFGDGVFNIFNIACDSTTPRTFVSSLIRAGYLSKVPVI